MKHEAIKMTTAQFAKLHNVNKKTLHYYDNIGLFSPCYKGENNYRYYDYMQSIEFEYIRMLKELNMEIKEIKAYINNPNEEDFLQLANKNIREIDNEIQSLKKTKEILKMKKRQLEQCKKIKDREIEIVECKEEAYLVTPFSFEDDNMHNLFTHINTVWNSKQYSMGIGSYISVDKIRDRNFDKYDGLFTYAQKNSKKSNIIIRPRGIYLYGYLKGSWDKLPLFYEEILCFAKDRGFDLTGFSYEIGMNDLAISNIDDYITQLMIRVEK